MGWDRHKSLWDGMGMGQINMSHGQPCECMPFDFLACSANSEKASVVVARDVLTRVCIDSCFYTTRKLLEYSWRTEHAESSHFFQKIRLGFAKRFVPSNSSTRLWSAKPSFSIFLLFISFSWEKLRVYDKSLRACQPNRPRDLWSPVVSAHNPSTCLIFESISNNALAG